MMTTIEKIVERDNLVVKAERGEISPQEFCDGLAETFAEMSPWDKFVENAIRGEGE